MLKLLSITLALVLSSPALATDFQLTCATEYPTTSFVITTGGDTLKARLMFHRGTEYAPVINGIFTPRDLPVLAERANLVRKLLPDTTFSWPLANCRLHDEIRFECFGSPSVAEGVDGAKIKASALYTGRQTEDSIAGVHSYVSVRFSFKVDGAGDPSVEMKYPAENCFDPRQQPGRVIP